MLCKSILILAFLFSAFWVEAKECALDVALRDPKIANNSSFWEDYSKLKNTQDEKAVGELLKKYGHNSESSPSNVVSRSSSSGAATQAGPRSLRVNISPKAEKEIENLRDGMKEKVDEFMATVAKPGGIKEIRDNPGRWRLEKLGGGNVQTVRLNKGTRIMFEVDGDDLRILRVNREQVHNDPYQ